MTNAASSADDLTRSHRYSFAWLSTYMGEAEYRVSGDGAPYCVRVRRSADEYHRSIYNGTAEEWTRDIVGALDCIYRCSDPATPVPLGVVAAFNDWLAREHAALIARFRGDPDHYGDLKDDHPAMRRPIPVQRAAYVTGTGWVRTEPFGGASDTPPASDL